MSIPEIPPAHREAVADAMDRSDYEWAKPENAHVPLWSSRADAAIATLLQLGYRVAPGWVACSERMPELGPWKHYTVILTECVYGLGSTHLLPELALWEGCVWMGADFNREPDRVKFWMPLPTPPTISHHATTDKGE